MSPDLASAGAPPRLACAHCGLPVPASERGSGAGPAFCCEGCRTVHETLRAAGLGDEYYALREAFDERAAAEPARASDRSYAAFDREAFADEHVRAGADGTSSLDLLLEGVHCAACVWLVERLPALDAGVLEARLNVRDARVSLRYDAARTSPSRIARALDRLGYPAHPPTRDEGKELTRREERRHLMAMGVAAVCAGNAMLVAFALYSAGEGAIAPEHATLFRWVGLGLGWLSILWPGRVFLRGAAAALRTRRANLDLPISLALVAGGLAGTHATVSGSGEAYFDSLTVLVLLLLVGRYVQARQQRWAADAVDLTRALTSATCRVEEDGGVVREITVGELRPGDVALVRPGEPFPADGEVVSGRTSVDLSLLSGESEPHATGPGDEVHAGSQNLSGVVRVRVRRVGGETRAGRLMGLVEAGLSAKPPIERFTDRVAGYFVVAVVTLSAATFAWWALRGAGVGAAVENTVALLIVACPCALGLATPLSLSVALGRAARAGVLVKDAAVLERLARPGALVLDKTGTITSGHAQLAAWIGDASLRGAVGALERDSSHPVARALHRALAAEARPGAFVRDVEEHGDGGIGGIVDGARLRVGSLVHLRRRGATLAAPLRGRAEALEREGYTVVGVAREADLDGAPARVTALAALADVARPDSAAAIASLRAAGFEPEVLSGDGAGAVGRVATEVGLGGAARARVEPEAKLERVRALQAEGRRVVMVGDGVNDAAALAAADVGIAVRGGAEISLAAADVFCAHAGLGPVVDLARLGRRTMAAIRVNLGVSLAYNVVGVALAATGHMSPLVAAVLMPVSSLTVLSLALILLARGPVGGRPRSGPAPAPAGPDRAPEDSHAPGGAVPCP